MRPVAGKHRVKRLQGFGIQRGQIHACMLCGVGSHHAGAAAIGQDGQLIGAVGAKPCQCLGREEQLLQGVHTQHSGACDCRLVNQIGAGQCAGMGGGGLLALTGTTGLDHDDRLVARGSTCRGHEFARCLNRLDVQQDGARAAVAGQIVQHVAEIDIGMFAQGHKMREADGTCTGPVEHGGHQGARLRHKCQFARRCRHMCKAGIQTAVRRQQADAIGTEDAQQPGSRRVEHGLALGLVQASGQHDRSTGAALAQFSDQAGYGGCRRADHRQVGHAWQVGHAGIDRLPTNVLMTGIDGIYRTLEATTTQIGPHGGADTSGSL